MDHGLPTESDMRARVLIFDDDEMIRQLLRDVCEKRGYEVIAFSDPGICPIHADQQCPCGPGKICADVIFSDLEMPIVKGLDFLESLLGKGCRCHHIALVSSSCDGESFARAARLGCKVIRKPFTRGEVINWLAEVERSLPANRCLLDREMCSRAASR